MVTTTASTSFNGYVDVYPSAPTYTYMWPNPIQGGTVSKFEQAFKVASALVTDGTVTVKDVPAFVALVKYIEEAL